MTPLDSQDHSDLTDPTIPLYPPLVLNPDLIERSRQKAMKIASLGADGINIEEFYPEAYNEMCDDLGDLANDFGRYVQYAESVIHELAELKERSGMRPLERHEYAPFYGKAKFRSALGVFGGDESRLKRISILISGYRRISNGNYNV